MKNISCFICILALVLGTAGCQKKPPSPITTSAFVLNTFVTVTLYDTDNEDILNRCIEICREYENIFSKTVSGSEIYKLNHRQSQETSFEISDKTADLLSKGLFYSELSSGGFDITIEPLSSLWNFTTETPKIPDEDEIADAAGKVGYQNIRLEGNQLTFLSPDTRLDLGAIAKGYIADQIKAYLLSEGVQSAVINLGGNVLCVGLKPDGTPFKIGLQKPFESHSETVATLNINDMSVVSSGVYERHFVLDGKNYHHLLNPKTGYPYENGLTAVTILSPLSVDGDALSTLCFSLGLEKGLELLDSMEDCYAIFITEDGNLHYSQGAEAFIQP